ncbi:MAG: hypothetical protein JO227_01925 [Acetobacteraceae bacterium]|nr:hypothetical protein [Acetobacteraceae bacterium]
MTTLLLDLFAALVAALLGLTLFARSRNRRIRRAIGPAASWIRGAGLVLALCAVGCRDGYAVLHLPFGVPGRSTQLALDPLCAPFLLLVFLASTASAVIITRGEPNQDHASSSNQLVSLAGCALSLLAADGITLALGLGLIAYSFRGVCGLSRLAPVLFGAGCVVVGTGLLSPGHPTLGFAEIRTGASSSLAASFGALISSTGFAAVSGLAPFHLRRLDKHSAKCAGLVPSVTVPVIGIYGLVRIYLDLASAASSYWWGLPLLIWGAVSSLLYATAAGPEMEMALENAAARWGGIAAMGLATAVMARAADLTPVALLALSGVWLAAGTQAICGTLLLLCARAIRAGAGTERLDLLGGLIHSMPVVSASLAVGLFAQAMLPGSAGFAAVWTLFQAQLGIARAGGVLHALPFVMAALVLGFGSAISSATLVRVFGVACLGRPRMPRSAAAEEAPITTRIVLAALSVVILLLGCFPGPALLLFGGPAIQMLTGAAVGGRAGLLLIAPETEAPGYAALPIVLLLVVIAVGVWWCMRRLAGGGERRAPAWEDGFAPPPAWLPFGDPATQSTGVGFMPEVHVDPLVRPYWVAIMRWAAELRGYAAAYAPGAPNAALVALALLLLTLLGLHVP